MIYCRATADDPRRTGNGRNSSLANESQRDTQGNIITIRVSCCVQLALLKRIDKQVIRQTYANGNFAKSTCKSDAKMALIQLIIVAYFVFKEYFTHSQKG